MKEALKLALEALETELAVDMNNGAEVGEAAELMCEAITAIKQALAAPVQEPVAWVCYGAPGKRDIDFEEADINKLPIGTLLYTTPPAQPAPVQATMKLESSGPGYGPAPNQKLSVRHVSLIDVGKTPFVQPAVPDAFGTREGEHPQYVQGWNDCRQTMLEILKARGNT